MGFDNLKGHISNAIASKQLKINSLQRLHEDISMGRVDEDTAWKRYYNIED